MTIEELLTAEIPAPSARKGSVIIRDATAADLLTGIRIIEEQADDHRDASGAMLIPVLKKLRTKMNRYGAYSVSDLPVRWIVKVLS